MGARGRVLLNSMSGWHLTGRREHAQEWKMWFEKEERRQLDLELPLEGTKGYRQVEVE